MINYPLAVFLDSNIFISSKYNFGSEGVLQIMKNLVLQKKAVLYISNIVVSEVEQHIKDDALIVANTLNSAWKDAGKKIDMSQFSNIAFTSALSVPLEQDFSAQIIDNFNSYLSDCSAIFLNNDGVNIDAIINDYFNFNPPFEQTGKKKHEFPDALIISKLKSQFSEAKPLCVISDDKGFREALSDQHIFTCFNSIKEFLDMVNKQDTKYKEIVSFINNNNNNQEMQNLIIHKIESDEIEIDGTDCDRKGVCSGYDYDEVMLDEVEVLSLEFQSVDDITEDYVLATLECSAKIGAICGFADYGTAMWDSEDKDYIFLDRIEVYEEHEPCFECNLKLSLTEEDGFFELDVADITFDLELNQYTRVKREPYK